MPNQTGESHRLISTATWSTAFLITVAPLLWPQAASAQTSVTYTRDVAPIIQQNCQACHRPGGIGPMSLLNFEDAESFAEVIKQKVSEREMPPYHYDTDVGIQALQHDMRLSDEEIETIVAWVDAGAPQGDPADLPPPLEWPDSAVWTLAERFGPPDHIVRSTPYDVPAYGGDLWHRPYVPTGITEDRCIMAVEVRPTGDAASVVHHGNTTFQTPTDDGGFERVSRLTEYAMGKVGEVMPTGTCRVAPANSYALWDIHFYPMGEALEDNVVEVAIWFHPENYREQVDPHIQTLDNYRLQGTLDIPPHGTAMTQGFHSFDHPVRIDSYQPHGHLRLRAASMEIFYPETGERELVSMVSNWSAKWQHSHIFEEDAAPLIPTGAVMILTHWYDNTADNPNNPDPDQWVYPGSRSTDEMTHDWIGVTHLDEATYERIAAEREASAEASAEGQQSDDN